MPKYLQWTCYKCLWRTQSLVFARHVSVCILMLLKCIFLNFFWFCYRTHTLFTLIHNLRQNHLSHSVSGCLVKFSMLGKLNKLILLLKMKAFPEYDTHLPLLSFAFQFAPFANSSFTHFRFPCVSKNTSSTKSCPVFIYNSAVPENIHTHFMKSRCKFRRGSGVSETKKKLKESMKLNWNFQRVGRGGGVLQTKNPQCERYGYFLE